MSCTIKVEGRSMIKNIEITYFKTHIKFTSNVLFLLYENFHIDSISINITGNHDYFCQQ